MSNPVQNVSIDQDLFYSVEDSDGQSIGLSLKLKDIEVNDHILFEETKKILGIPIKTGRKLLTKVIRTEHYKSDMYWIIVKRVN